MNQFDKVFKYDDKQADEDCKLAKSYVKWSRSKKALRKMPQHFEALRGQYNELMKQFDTLESEKAALQREKTKLESEKAALQREKTNLESKNADLEKKYDSMLAANQKLTANNPNSVGGDSATTYLQWIEEYILLLQAYSDDVRDVVIKTDKNIDDLRNLVTEILEYGFSGRLKPNDKSKLQASVDGFLRPEHKNDGLKEYKKFHRFFDALFELANKAEQYKESFYILAPPRGTSFDSTYARIPSNEDKKLDVENKGKKIERCYLPTVLFFFATNSLAACAPALVELEAEKPKSPTHHVSSPNVGDYGKSNYGW